MPNDLQIHLHSPSAHIIGTPFQFDSSPYEYPFPTSQASSSSSTATSTSSIPSLVVSPIQFSSSSYIPPVSLSKFTPTHPKLRPASPPPVPPTLLQKSRQWSTSTDSLRVDSKSGTSKGLGATPKKDDGGRRHSVDVGSNYRVPEDRILSSRSAR
ncbi:hypothetical protein D9758_008540 [Tetrapyrgos nigripes]|uniref:Uncharacterized protein n=1 Tax=Tetrapyrgos nigripes TaxID=182062 RepID=A0A8H5G5Q4_9AGAR|nr:hypothetical protein D9758_008540 [Tetrapyrgos nigripes]